MIQAQGRGFIFSEGAMRILTEHDFEKVFGADSSINIYEKYLSFYKSLESHESILLERINGISLSDILYSKYYWFLKLKRENERINGMDAGYDQQADDLVVSIYEYSGVDFDADIYAKSIETIENLVYG